MTVRRTTAALRLRSSSVRTGHEQPVFDSVTNSTRRQSLIRKRPEKHLQQLVKGGFAALAAGDRKTAIDYCRRVIRERPDMARGHYLAGQIALEGHDVVAAEKAFATTVQLNEKHAGGWAQLAKLYLLGGEFIKADGCLKNAVLTTRGNASVQDLIGSAFRLAGNHAASLEWHEKAVATAPDHTAFRINLANALLYTGNTVRANAELDLCLEQDPGNTLAHWLLSRARTATTTSHIKEMEKRLSAPLERQQAAYLHYAVGKEYEDLQEWVAAFDAYEAGAAARRECVAYDEAADIELFKELNDRFGNSWANGRESACNSRMPIFIVGQPRTGTTLLDRMLDAHPAVHSAGELRHFGLAVRRASGNFDLQQYSASLMESASTADLATIGELYVASVESLRGDAAHVIDKLPSNYLYLPVIMAALPNAKVLHMRRDPTDTCFAEYKTLFAGAYLYSYTQPEMARHYVRYYAFMDRMRADYGDRIFDVDYEKLVSDPETLMRAVLEHCGLSWNAACVENFSNGSAVATQSAAQVREAPHQRSVGRWRRYADRLEPMRAILREAGIIETGG